MQVFLIAALIVAILAVVFAIQNAVPVTVGFLTWRFEGSLALVLLITFALGVITSLLFSLPGMIRRRRTISDLRRKIQSQERSLRGEREALPSSEPLTPKDDGSQ